MNIRSVDMLAMRLIKHMDVNIDSLIKHGFNCSFVKIDIDKPDDDLDNYQCMMVKPCPIFWGSPQVINGKTPLKDMYLLNLLEECHGKFQKLETV